MKQRGRKLIYGDMKSWEIENNFYILCWNLSLNRNDHCIWKIKNMKKVFTYVACNNYISKYLIIMTYHHRYLLALNYTIQFPRKRKPFILQNANTTSRAFRIVEKNNIECRSTSPPNRMKRNSAFYQLATTTDKTAASYLVELAKATLRGLRTFLFHLVYLEKHVGWRREVSAAVNFEEWIRRM